MAQLCLYFQLHQPYRLQPFSVFDLSQKRTYLDETLNEQVFQKVAEKSYLPMLSLLLELTALHPQFCFALSCSGVFLEQAAEYCPEVIVLMQRLVATGQVEMLAETYYHSLASLYSPIEFAQQVLLHGERMNQLFGVTPTTFRNTELIYSNDIAQQVAQLGFAGMLTEGVDRHLNDRRRTQLFRSSAQPTLPLLLKHAQLSDDIAFRFSNRDWPEYPLTADKYLWWLGQYEQNEIVNLFMDFETFGEHQWQDTGIFAFFRQVVKQSIQVGHQFVTPAQLLEPVAADTQLLEHLPVYDVPEPISWADVDRDLTAWRGNSLQHDTLRLMYSLEEQVRATADEQLLDDWRKLQTSDHFYYMCVKWSSDGDVHKYFSPYDSPFDAYNRFTAILTDMQDRLERTICPDR